MLMSPSYFLFAEKKITHNLKLNEKALIFAYSLWKFYSIVNSPVQDIMTEGITEAKHLMA